VVWLFNICFIYQRVLNLYLLYVPAKTFADLVCCDFCTKSFHLKCHVPILHQKPPGKWKCCECKAPEMLLMECGKCTGELFAR